MSLSDEEDVETLRLAALLTKGTNYKKQVFDYSQKPDKLFERSGNLVAINAYDEDEKKSAPINESECIKAVSPNTTDCLVSVPCIEVTTVSNIESDGTSEQVAPLSEKLQVLVSEVAKVSETAQTAVSETAQTAVSETAPTAVSETAQSAVSETAQSTVSETAQSTVSETAHSTVSQAAQIEIPPATVFNVAHVTVSRLTNSEIATVHSSMIGQKSLSDVAKVADSEIVKVPTSVVPVARTLSADGVELDYDENMGDKLVAAPLIQTRKSFAEDELDLFEEDDGDLLLNFDFETDDIEELNKIARIKKHSALQKSVPVSSTSRIDLPTTDPKIHVDLPKTEPKIHIELRETIPVESVLQNEPIKPQKMTKEIAFDQSNIIENHATNQAAQPQSTKSSNTKIPSCSKDTSRKEPLKLRKPLPTNEAGQPQLTKSSNTEIPPCPKDIIRKEPLKLRKPLPSRHKQSQRRRSLTPRTKGNALQTHDKRFNRGRSISRDRKTRYRSRSYSTSFSSYSWNSSRDSCSSFSSWSGSGSRSPEYRKRRSYTPSPDRHRRRSRERCFPVGLSSKPPHSRKRRSSRSNIARRPRRFDKVERSEIPHKKHKAENTRDGSAPPQTEILRESTSHDKLKLESRKKRFEDSNTLQIKSAKLSLKEVLQDPSPLATPHQVDSSPKKIIFTTTATNSTEAETGASKKVDKFDARMAISSRKGEASPLRHKEDSSYSSQVRKDIHNRSNIDARDMIRNKRSHNYNRHSFMHESRNRTHHPSAYDVDDNDNFESLRRRIVVSDECPPLEDFSPPTKTAYDEIEPHADKIHTSPADILHRFAKGVPAENSKKRRRVILDPVHSDGDTLPVSHVSSLYERTLPIPAKALSQLKSDRGETKVGGIMSRLGPRVPMPEQTTSSDDDGKRADARSEHIGSRRIDISPHTTTSHYRAESSSQPSPADSDLDNVAENLTNKDNFSPVDKDLVAEFDFSPRDEELRKDSDSDNLPVDSKPKKEKKTKKSKKEKKKKKGRKDKYPNVRDIERQLEAIVAALPSVSAAEIRKKKQLQSTTGAAPLPQVDRPQFLKKTLSKYMDLDNPDDM